MIPAAGAAVLASGLLLEPLGAIKPLASRIAHTDPSRLRQSTGVHRGAGRLDFTGLLDFHALDTILFFLHRGVIRPKSGIGHHFHKTGAPARMGHSHAFYNAAGRRSRDSQRNPPTP